MNSSEKHFVGCLSEPSRSGDVWWNRYSTNPVQLRYGERLGNRRRKSFSKCTSRTNQSHRRMLLLHWVNANIYQIHLAWSILQPGSGPAGDLKDSMTHKGRWWMFSIKQCHMCVESTPMFFVAILYEISIRYSLLHEPIHFDIHSAIRANFFPLSQCVNSHIPIGANPERIKIKRQCHLSHSREVLQSVLEMPSRESCTSQVIFDGYFWLNLRVVLRN